MVGNYFNFLKNSEELHSLIGVDKARVGKNAQDVLHRKRWLSKGLVLEATSSRFADFLAE